MRWFEDEKILKMHVREEIFFWMKEKFVQAAMDTLLEFVRLFMK